MHLAAWGVLFPKQHADAEHSGQCVGQRHAIIAQYHFASLSSPTSGGLEPGAYHETGQMCWQLAVLGTNSRPFEAHLVTAYACDALCRCETQSALQWRRSIN